MMHAAWVSFATCGDPGWEQYDLNQRLTMQFDTRSDLLKGPRRAERALWEGLRSIPLLRVNTHYLSLPSRPHSW